MAMKRRLLSPYNIFLCNTKMVHMFMLQLTFEGVCKRKNLEWLFASFADWVFDFSFLCNFLIIVSLCSVRYSKYTAAWLLLVFCRLWLAPSPNMWKLPPGGIFMLDISTFPWSHWGILSVHPIHLLCYCKKKIKHYLKIQGVVKFE